MNILSDTVNFLWTINTIRFHEFSSGYCCANENFKMMHFLKSIHSTHKQSRPLISEEESISDKVRLTATPRLSVGRKWGGFLPLNAIQDRGQLPARPEVDGHFPVFLNITPK